MRKRKGLLEPSIRKNPSTSLPLTMTLGFHNLFRLDFGQKSNIPAIVRSIFSTLVRLKRQMKENEEKKGAFRTKYPKKPFHFSATHRDSRLSQLTLHICEVAFLSKPFIFVSSRYLQNFYSIKIYPFLMLYINGIKFQDHQGFFWEKKFLSVKKKVFAQGVFTNYVYVGGQKN